MGGFSEKTQDYNDIGYILPIHESTWQKRTWAHLKHHGSRMDMSCAQINWNQDLSVIVAGGWNNSAMRTTDFLSPSKMKTLQIKTYSGSESVPPLSEAIRSSAMAEFGGQPMLIGGVICQG